MKYIRNIPTNSFVVKKVPIEMTDNQITKYPILVDYNPVLEQLFNSNDLRLAAYLKLGVEIQPVLHQNTLMAQLLRVFGYTDRYIVKGVEQEKCPEKQIQSIQ